MKRWVLTLLLVMLALPAQAETITSVTQYAYDTLGRPTCTTVRMNPATFGSPPADACTLGPQGSDGPDQITYTQYNATNEVTSVTTGYGTTDPRREIKNQYSSNGKVGLVTDGENNTTSLSYDEFDRPSYTHYPMPTKGSLLANGDDKQLLSYDDVSNVTQVRRRDGQLIGKTYDALNRLIFEDKPGTALDTTYTYDNLGRIKSSSIPGRTLSMVYDALGRLTEEASPLGTMRYGYDLAGNRIRISWPDWFWVAYDYNLAGEVTSIRENGTTSGPGILMIYFHDDLGRRTSAWPGDGSVTWYAYDTASRLSAMNLDLSGTAADQITSFTYNAAGQLKRRTASNTAYDFTAATTASPSYQANGLNQYLTVGATTKSYDTRGNYSCDSVNTATGACGGTSYVYDIENHLTDVVGGGVTTSLSYDSAGRLFTVARGGSNPISTRFLYSGQDLVAEFDGAGAGALLRRYVPGPGTDEPVVWYEGANTTTRRWRRADERGSIVAVTDAAGALVNAAPNTYDEYGVPGAGNAGRFQYTGQAWLPEVGLYHYKARVYSPTLGRFLQTDPEGYDDGLNWYAYVGNDPVNMADPTGEAMIITTTCVQGGATGTPDKPVIVGGCKTTYEQFGDDSDKSRGPPPAPKPAPFHLIPSAEYRRCYADAMGSDGSFLGDLAAGLGLTAAGSPIIPKPRAGFGGGGPSGSMTSPLSKLARSIPGLRGPAGPGLRKVGSAFSPGASRSAGKAANVGRISSKVSGILGAWFMVDAAGKAADASAACNAAVGR